MASLRMAAIYYNCTILVKQQGLKIQVKRKTGLNVFRIQYAGDVFSDDIELQIDLVSGI